MSWDFFNVKTVKAAKPHSCEQCGRQIAVGTVHEYAAGKFDGDFNAYREHLECRAAWTEYSKEELRWDETAPFLRDADCLSEDKEWFFAKHPIVAARLWPDEVNTAHKNSEG
jgi:hypothetical protein